MLLLGHFILQVSFFLCAWFAHHEACDFVRRDKNNNGRLISGHLPLEPLPPVQRPPGKPLLPDRKVGVDLLVQVLSQGQGGHNKVGGGNYISLKFFVVHCQDCVSA